jgi:hypothetical protein
LFVQAVQPSVPTNESLPEPEHARVSSQYAVVAVNDVQDVSLVGQAEHVEASDA